MRPHATKKEQALLLHNSFSGDAEQEFEHVGHVGIDEIYNDQGIEVTLQNSKIPLCPHITMFQKHKFLHEYETLPRYQSELIRTYIAKFRRSIRNLKAVGVDVTATYDGEALGSRLLDRSGLSVESQRLVLIGTGQCLQLEAIAEALILQYRDFRFSNCRTRGQGKGPRPALSSSSTTASSSSGKGTSSMSKSSAYRNAYVAENNEANSLESIQENQTEMMKPAGMN